MHFDWALRQSVVPGAEPLTLAETKVVLRVDADITQDDAYISSLIAAARAAAEVKTERQLMPATYELTLSAWPWSTTLRLPRPPVTAVSKIEYFDADDALQELPAAAYRLHTEYEPAIVELVDGETWPTLALRRDAVKVTYAAGYADAAAVPAGIKNWMLVKIATWYEQRQTVQIGAPMSSSDEFLDGLLDPHTVRTFP